MHIPDNYLSPATCAAMGAAMAPVWTKAVKKAGKEETKERLPMLGVGAAFAFLIMMLNIPLPGGTSVHAVGGVLLAVLLGPWEACLSLTVALLVQALLFGDGGLLAFGANCFNMAFAMPFTGYAVYRFVKQRFRSPRAEIAGVALGSFFGINVAALCAAVEFGLQPLLFRNASGLPLYCPYPLSVTIPAMLLPHLFVAGPAEAAFSAAVFAFVRRVSPRSVLEPEAGAKRVNPLYAALLALVCLSPLGLLAAGPAWGEWDLASIQNVITNGKALGSVPGGMANGFRFSSLLHDYSVSGLPPFAGYILSAAAGAAILVIAFKLLGLAVRKKRAGREGP